MFYSYNYGLLNHVAFFPQLYTRLSKVGICVSHKTTIRVIDEIGTGFDSHVKNWCKDITTALWGQQSRYVNSIV